MGRGGTQTQVAQRVRGARREHRAVRDQVSQKKKGSSGSFFYVQPTIDILLENNLNLEKSRKSVLLSSGLQGAG